MSELTKEWLHQTIAQLEEERDAVPGVVNEDAAMALAAMKIAVASLEAEPVAWIVHARTGDQLTTDGGYVANAEGILGLHSTPLYTAPPAPVSDSLLSELLGIAKRAAAEAGECAHAEFSDDSMKHSAAIADWERRAAMLRGADGNSPVIPDGYVLVPFEPTAEMISSGITAHFERSQIQIHDRPAPGPMECAYVAMLSAAPQQEVK
ncbi:hypothetical protein SL069_003051 [Enterobacter hormaechei]|nr:hypothetical protein [Enterobacter hormaechei]